MAAILSFTGLVVTLLIMIFSLTFGPGQCVAQQTLAPAPESAPGHPHEVPAPSTPPPVMIRLSHAVEQLDSKVEQLEDAVARRARNRGR